MITKKKILILLLALFSIHVFSQKKTNLELKNTLEKIISNKKTEVGILIIGTQNDIISIKTDNFYLNKKDNIFKI